MWYPGWLFLALFLLAFAGFEVVKHGGWVIPLAVLGALVPLAGTAAQRLPRTTDAQERRPGLPPLRWLCHPVPPVLVLISFTVFPDTQQQAAPGFTLGLMWLAVVALLRARRPFRQSAA
ncbi:hypothetical protein PJ985_17455 [Streptomyces sp. ACA25]|uniref:hypothetical protein n=1 Tax=Streptomyces sp. ACA25 TaxID=3022596 RepID=UPI0023081D9B|nr:hypothetical protein [Streptomyces sp. ACA25]MDB1089353.1 hypothetical protein [Streptomyces sp. ACA25]